MNRDIVMFFIGVFVGVAIIRLMLLSIIKANSEHEEINKILVCQVSQIENLREGK